MVAGMIAGADSIDDLDVLRHGGMAKVLTGVRAPSTVGTFLRTFTFGHVRQLDAVSSRVLAGLAAVVPRLLAGTEAMAFVDIDDTIREVHGYKKQGVAYGYSGVKGLNAQLAALSSPTCAPVIAASRLRKGNTISGHGGAKLIGDAVATARRAGASGQVMVRADSGYYRRDVITAALKAKAWFSVTVRMNPAVVRAIAGIPEDAWTTIKYPRAIWDEDEKRWISEAQVAETTFTAFTSARRTSRCPAGWWSAASSASTRPLTAAGQDELFTQLASPRVRHELHPDRRRCGRDPPRPRDHRAGHRRAQERPPRARPVGQVRRQRRLARPGLPRVQPPARGRRRRLGPPRESTVGHPADPARRGPRPGRVLGPPADVAPADELALGVRLGQPLGHRHRQQLLTTRATRPRGTTQRGKAGQTGQFPMPARSNTENSSANSAYTIPRKHGRWIRAQPASTRGDAVGEVA